MMVSDAFLDDNVVTRRVVRRRDRGNQEAKDHRSRDLEHHGSGQTQAVGRKGGGQTDSSQNT